MKKKSKGKFEKNLKANENIIYQHAVKRVLSRKFMAINICIKKKEESQINSLNLYLKELYLLFIKKNRLSTELA